MVVAPVDPAKAEVGDIVLARVAGTVYLHLVSSVDPARKRVQISNNRGRVNGWTSHSRVFGICVEVDGYALSWFGLGAPIDLDAILEEDPQCVTHIDVHARASPNCRTDPGTPGVAVRNNRRTVPTGRGRVIACPTTSPTPSSVRPTPRSR